MVRSAALRTLCAHTYSGVDAVVTPCTRCGIGWNRKSKRCDAYLGVEHLPLVAGANVPDCPMALVCQHQVQQPEPCLVRARGLVCESALAWAGDPAPADHPLGFNACVVAE